LLSDKLKQDIESALSVLIGENLRYLYRAGNMLTLGFGKDVKYIKTSGEETARAQFALHVQTSWRITENNNISLGSYDFYVPRDGVSYEEFQNDENDGFGQSVFDKKTEELNESLISERRQVTGIKASVFGDVCVLMDGGINLEIFVNSSMLEESWRFFETGKDAPHFVVFD